MLAIAANFLVQMGPAVVRVTEFRPAPATITPVDSQARSGSMLRVPRDTKSFAATLGSLTTAMRVRMDDDSPLNILEAERARQALDREGEKLLAESSAADARNVQSFRQEIRRHGQRADELLHSADEVRRLLILHRQTFESIDQRVKATMDRSWKIFGRIIARQSLVDVSRSLDELRPDLARLAGQDTAGVLEEMTVKENALAKMVESNERGLARSYGEAWLQGLRQELVTLVETRDALLQQKATTNTLFARFEHGGPLLLSSADVLRREGAGKVARQLAAVAPLRHGPPARNHPARPPAAVPENNKGALLAWLSGGVLLVLLGLSAGTVIGIVRPIRKLMAATQRLAAGEHDVLVPRHQGARYTGALLQRDGATALCGQPARAGIPVEARSHG